MKANSQAILDGKRIRGRPGKIWLRGHHYNTGHSCPLTTSSVQRTDMIK